MLDVDLEAGAASFLQVDANAVDTDNPDRVLDLDTTLNLTGLTGTTGDDGIILFAGEAHNEVTVNVQLTLEGDLVHLVGETTPPPGSADFFIFTLDALGRALR